MNALMKKNENNKTEQSKQPWQNHKHNMVFEDETTNNKGKQDKHRKSKHIPFFWNKMMFAWETAQYLYTF